MRNPTPADAVGMHRIVRESGVLDLNSLYCYLLVCRDFASTSLVACRTGGSGGGLLGFVSAYRPPRRPESLFVWQVGVAAEARRRGLALRMLTALVELPAAQGVTALEATVTPSNQPSRRLFERFAAAAGSAVEVGPGFGAADFGGSHEREDRFRIPLAAEAAVTRA